MSENYIFSHLVNAKAVKCLSFSDQEIKLIFEAMVYLRARHYDSKKRDGMKLILNKMNQLRGNR